MNTNLLSLVDSKSNYKNVAGYLENGGSRNIHTAVGTPASPVKFTLTPSGQDVIAITKLKVQYGVDGRFDDPSGFGDSPSALANGFYVSKTVDEYEHIIIPTVKTNIDFLRYYCFHDTNDLATAPSNLFTDGEIIMVGHLEAFEMLQFITVLNPGETLNLIAQDDMNAINLAGDLNFMDAHYIGMVLS